MNCKEAKKQLHAYLDCEQDCYRQPSLLSHLSECMHCQNELDQIQSIRRHLKCIAPVPPPDRLRARILRNLSGTHADAAGIPMESQSGVISRFAQYFKPVVTHMVALCAGGLLVYHVMQISTETTLPQEYVVSAHAKSLMGTQLTQITSTDKHAVGPWFSGKIDFAPRVLDLASSGFRLAGGRVDYLDNRKFAVLVYSRRKHTISLFVAPGPHDFSAYDDGETHWSSRGYNAYSWHDRDMHYTAISDLSADELAFFADIYRS